MNNLDPVVDLAENNSAFSLRENATARFTTGLISIQKLALITPVSPGAGIGRQSRLKIVWPYGRVGSSPTLGTNKYPAMGYFAIIYRWTTQLNSQKI